MRTIIVVALIATVSALPAFAQAQTHKRAGTIAKWTLIGAGAGFGIGFLQGMRVYDDAIYAEQKIWRAAWLSALAGGAIGVLVGAARSHPGRQPSVSSLPVDSRVTSAWARVRLKPPASPTDRLYDGLFTAAAE
jgi:hypothetical protein